MFRAGIDYVVTPSGCWESLRSRTPKGYARVWNGERLVGHHRLSYEHHTAILKPREIVRHDCDNPPCIRPDHLRAGTPRQNTGDALERGRMGKLSTQDVREIRRLREGGWTYARLGKKFGVTQSSACNVCLGATWRNVS